MNDKEFVNLKSIIEKPVSGEWGDNDETGNGIYVLRTTNFTNDGVIDFSNTVKRQITKKNIENKFLKHGDILIEKSGGSDYQSVGRVVYFEEQSDQYLFNIYCIIKSFR